MATEIIHTVKPGGGGDYVTIHAWEVAQKRNLVTADEIAVAEVYSGGNLGTAARFQTLPPTWVTDATRFIVIRAAPGQEHTSTGTLNTAEVYWDQGTTGNNAFYWHTVEVFHSGFQVKSTTTNYALAFNYSSSDVELRDMLLISVASGPPPGSWVGLIDNRTADFRAYNCIMIRDHVNWTYQLRVYMGQSSSLFRTNIYNCTFIGRGTALTSSYGGYVSTAGNLTNFDNCYQWCDTGSSTRASFVSVFAGMAVIGPGTATVDALSPTAALRNIPFTTAEFANVTDGTYDFTPVLGGLLVDVGEDLSPDITDDIIGTERPSGDAFDCGAVELIQLSSAEFTSTATADVFGGIIGAVAQHGDESDKPTLIGGLACWSALPKLYQSFKGAGGNILSCTLWMYRQGTTTADVLTANIYAHTGTYGPGGAPTGSSLEVSSSSYIVSDTTLPLSSDDPDMVRIEFRFDGTYFLDYDTPYCLVIETGTGSVFNYPIWGGTTDGSFSGETGYWNGAAWVPSNAGHNRYFVVYTDNMVIPYDSSDTIGTEDAVTGDGFLTGEEVAIENIWNTALTHLGAPTVDSTADGSPEATLLNEVWDTFFEEFLTDHSWNGAKTTAVLTQLVDSAAVAVAPPTRWAYAYALPSDYLQALRVNGYAMQPQTQVLHEVETITVDGVKVSALFSNQSSAELEYIFDIGNQTSLLKPKVRQACAMLLAAFVAPQFGKTEQEIEGYRRRGELTLADARAIDGQENTPQFFAETPLLDARNRGRRGRW